MSVNLYTQPIEDARRALEIYPPEWNDETRTRLRDALDNIIGCLKVLAAEMPEKHPVIFCNEMLDSPPVEPRCVSNDNEKQSRELNFEDGANAGLW